LPLGEKMEAILAKYPQHKRVIFLFDKYNRKEHLTPIEKDEVVKFHKLLIK
jgi:hypothetical protein